MDLREVTPDALYDRFILTTDALVTGLPVVRERRELGAEILRRLKREKAMTDICSQAWLGGLIGTDDVLRAAQESEAT